MATKTLWEQFLEKLEKDGKDFSKVTGVSDDTLRVKIFEKYGFIDPFEQGELVTSWKNASGKILFYSSSIHLLFYG